MKGITLQEIVKELDRIAPFATQMDFDNAGLLVGDGDRTISKALVCLDITPDVVAQAQKIGAELIVSHHPVIFRPLKRLEGGSVPYLLARADICAVSVHTNYDFAPRGVNFHLAQALGLADLQGLAGGEVPEAIFGTLPREMEPVEFARWVRQAIGADGVTLVDGGRSIRTVGLCGGAGGEYIFEAAGRVDAFVTGEMKHHEQLFAKSAGITAVVGGHFATERLAMEPLRAHLQEVFPAVEFRLAEECAPGRVVK